jgi:hypothetical protein
MKEQMLCHAKDNDMCLPVQPPSSSYNMATRGNITFIALRLPYYIQMPMGFYDLLSKGGQT